MLQVGSEKLKDERLCGRVGQMKDDKHFKMSKLNKLVIIWRVKHNLPVSPTCDKPV